VTKVRQQHINYISLCDQSQTVAHKLGFFSDLCLMIERLQ